jgi:hypothetical protein
MEPEFDKILFTIMELLFKYSGSSPVIQTEIDKERNDMVKRYQESAMRHSTMNAAACFMVDFTGNDEVKVEMKDMLDMADAIGRVGALAHAVETFLHRHHANVTDRGAGVVGWHIGAHCSPGEAWHMYRDAQLVFHAAIEAHLLTITIKPWSVRRMDEARTYRSSQ